MIRYEHIKTEDYRRVGLENEYWLWYFTASEKNSNHQIQPLNGQTDEVGFHPFKFLVEQMELPVFESKTQESIDFLITMSPYLIPKNLYLKDNYFATVILGFNHLRLVSSTHHPNKCFCSEGIVEIVAEMNPELLGKLKFD